jgi:hypothetical protein
MNTITTADGITHNLATEFIGQYKAMVYVIKGGIHCPNFDQAGMIGTKNHSFSGSFWLN